jgi:hypothetical protein
VNKKGKRKDGRMELKRKEMSKQEGREKNE